MKHTSNFERITPELAKELLTYNHDNRPPSERHIEYLTEEIEQNRFMPTTAIHVAYDLDSLPTLINGQQTLMAIIKADKSVTLNIVRSTECLPEDRIMLYVNTDIARKRTFADSAAAIHMPQQMNIGPWIVSKIGIALRFMWSGFGLKATGRHTSKLPDSILFEHVPRWAPEARLLDLTTSPMPEGYRSLFYKAPIYSVALLTAFYQPDKAKEFWSQVIHDDGLSLADPRKTLHDYLPKTKGIASGTPAVSNHVQARAVSYCWNAFMEDRLLQVINVAERNANLPMVL